MMFCQHKKTMTYTLTSQDRKDFELTVNGSSKSEQESEINFLTPSLRCTRAKSVVTSSKTDKENEGSQIAQFLHLNELEDYASVDKRLASHRNQSKPIIAPRNFKNCEDCGALYFREGCAAVKPRQYCYRLETIPAGILCSLFLQQKEQRQVYLRPSKQMKDPFGQQIYLNGRKRIIDGVYKMGVKFQQARETIHIAIEIIDQFYLRKSQQKTNIDFKDNYMLPRLVLLHQVTSLLIASKYDEVDDNITTIRDLRAYIQNQLYQLGKRDISLVPTFNQIVECERRMLADFEWNLKFILPLHFIRLQLANGILFSNELKAYEDKLQPENMVQLKTELTRALTTETLSLSDLLISRGACFLRKERPSDIAAAIIYFARKNILFSEQASKNIKVPTLWPTELVIMMRCTESQIRRLLSNPLEETYKVEEDSTLIAKSLKPQNKTRQQLRSPSKATKEKQTVTSPIAQNAKNPNTPKVSFTEVKNFDKQLLTKTQDDKKKDITTQNYIESIKQNTSVGDKDTQSDQCIKMQIKSVKQASVSLFPNIDDNNNERQDRFSSQLLAVTMQSLRASVSPTEVTNQDMSTEFMQSKQDAAIVRKNPPGINVASKSMVQQESDSQGKQSISQKSKGSFQQNTKKTANGEPRQYILSTERTVTSSVEVLVDSQTTTKEDQVIMTSKPSIEPVTNIELINETSLPEIKANTKRKQIFIQPLDQHITQQNPEHFTNIPKEKRQISQNSTINKSQPLSSSKRPQNAIGIRDIATEKPQQQQQKEQPFSQVQLDRQTGVVKKFSSNSSKQLLKKSIDNTNNNKQNENSRLACPSKQHQQQSREVRKPSQRQLQMTNSITSAQRFADQVNVPSNQTRNNCLNRKGSNPNAINLKNFSGSGQQSAAEMLHQVKHSTSNSNEYFTFHNTTKQPQASNKKSQIKSGGYEGLSHSQEFLNMYPNPNESMIQVINNSKPVNINRQPLISPPINQIKAKNQKKQINFRGNKNFHSIASHLGSGNVLQKLQAQQVFKRNISQESLNEKTDNRSAFKKNKKFKASESCESVAQNTANIVKSQSTANHKENTAPINFKQHFPSIGNTSQQTLKENDRHMGNIQDSVRYNSGGPNITNLGSSNLMIQQNSTIFSKVSTKIDQKDSKNLKNSSLKSSVPTIQQEPMTGIYKNQTQQFGKKQASISPIIPQTTKNNTNMGIHRLTIRKGPSLGAISQITTPTETDDSIKVQVQKSHRILSKNTTTQSLVGIPSQQTVIQNSQKFTKNAARGRNGQNQRNQSTKAQKEQLRQSYQGASSTNANTSQAFLAQMHINSTINSYKSSMIGTMATNTLNSGSNTTQVSMLGPMAEKTGAMHRRNNFVQQNNNINVEQQAQIDVLTRASRLAVKNRNHNFGHNLTGVVPFHGLINANFNTTKTKDSKESFASNSYRQSTINDTRSPDIVENKTVKHMVSKVHSTGYQSKQRLSMKSQIHKEGI